MITIKKDKEKQMLAQLDLAIKSAEMGSTAYSGMTYEDGVKAALEFVMIDDCEPPIDVNDINF